MQHDFWQQKWLNNEIGFHLEQVNPLLIKYYPLVNQNPRPQVLVPLAGKSLDMHWLAQQNAAVVGCELSHLACQQFFAENNLPVTTFVGSDFKLFKQANLELLCGDFFKLSPQLIGRMDGCYDRAALIALPADLRQAYVKKVSELLLPGAWYLLIVIVFDCDSTAVGPPFSVDDAEVQRLFAADFKISCLKEQAEPPQSSVAGGSVPFCQRVYRLQRK